MAPTYDVLIENEICADASDSCASPHRTSKAAHVSVALALLISLGALIVAVIDGQPHERAAQLRTMFGRPPYCKGKNLKECMAIMWATKEFEPYKAGIKDVLSRPDSERTPSFEDFFSASLDHCTCKRAGTCAVANNTIVTAVLDIHRDKWDKKRSFGKYTDVLKDVVFKRFAKTPKVVFIEKGYGEEVAAAHPGGADSPYLCLLEISIEDLPDYAMAKDWARGMNTFFETHRHNMWPQTMVPTYDVLMTGKFATVARAATQNVFGSTAFAWVDGGIHYPQSHFMPYDSVLDILTCGDKLCIGMSLNPTCWHDIWNRRFKNSKSNITFDCHACEIGATFTGSREAVLNIVKPFYGYVREYLREGVVDSDQGIMFYLYLHRPDLVEAQPCNSFLYCTGYLLGGHSLSNVSRYLWGDCVDDEGSVAWLERQTEKSGMHP